MREAGQLKHRQASRAATAHKPRPLAAHAPNQVYSWDITYLQTAMRGIFLYLLRFMDRYSRKIVGWQVYEEESSEWAADIVRDITQREGITLKQITLHADNGGPMKGASMLAAMAQQKRIQPLLRLPFQMLHVFPCARQIAHRFLFVVGYPYRG